MDIKIQIAFLVKFHKFVSSSEALTKENFRPGVSVVQCERRRWLSLWHNLYLWSIQQTQAMNPFKVTLPRNALWCFGISSPRNYRSDPKSIDERFTSRVFDVALAQPWQIYLHTIWCGSSSAVIFVAEWWQKSCLPPSSVQIENTGLFDNGNFESKSVGKRSIPVGKVPEGFGRLKLNPKSRPRIPQPAYTKWPFLDRSLAQPVGNQVNGKRVQLLLDFRGMDYGCSGGDALRWGVGGKPLKYWKGAEQSESGKLGSRARRISNSAHLSARVQSFRETNACTRQHVSSKQISWKSSVAPIEQSPCFLDRHIII